jgi:hypothetical protein
LFWPKFDVVSLRKTPAKVSFTPTLVAPVTEIHEVAEIDDDDSVYSETEDLPFRVPAVELFPEDQEHSLNFIVEGCTFRGDIEIPTPPPSDAEQEDPPPDSDGRPWKDVRIPSPDNERFIPSAAFSRSRREEERSNTPPDDFDRYLADSFRPVSSSSYAEDSTSTEIFAESSYDRCCPCCACCPFLRHCGSTTELQRCFFYSSVTW